jgi:hypothetical protein
MDLITYYLFNQNENKIKIKEITKKFQIKKDINYYNIFFNYYIKKEKPKEFKKLDTKIKSIEKNELYKIHKINYYFIKKKFNKLLKYLNGNLNELFTEKVYFLKLFVLIIKFHLFHLNDLDTSLFYFNIVLKLFNFNFNNSNFVDNNIDFYDVTDNYAILNKKLNSVHDNIIKSDSNKFKNDSNFLNDKNDKNDKLKNDQLVNNQLLNIYILFIDYYLKQRNEEVAIQYFTQAREKLKLNQYIFNLFISFHSTYNNGTKMLDYYHLMVDTFKIIPNYHTYFFFIKYYLKINDKVTVYDFFSKMKSHNLISNNYVFNYLIKHYFKIEDEEVALKYYHELETFNKFGVKPDVFTFNSLLLYYYIHSNSEKFNFYYDIMKSFNILNNEKTEKILMDYLKSETGRSFQILHNFKNIDLFKSTLTNKIKS